MKKAATILFWVSLSIDILYVVVTIICALLGGAMNPVGTTDGLTYGIALFYQLFMCGMPLIVKMILMLIIIFSMKGESERIIGEVIMIILFSGVGILVESGIASLVVLLLGNIMGTSEYMGFVQANSMAAWGSFLHVIANSITILAAAFAIAYKKCELTDLSRLKEEQDV